MHLNYDGLAVSPDGEMLAAATPFTAINRLDLIEWRAGVGQALVHADPQRALLQPTFSPDGQQLAFVVAQPSKVGQITNVSEIWISDLNGVVIKRIAEEGRLFTNPVFSPDGRRLAYFRDVEHDAGSSPDDVERRETREIVAMVAFEFDLEDGTQTQLSFQPFGSPRGLHYVPGSSGDFILEVGPPLSPVDVNGEPRWTLTPEIVSAMSDQIAAGQSGANVFRWQRGAPMPLFPRQLYGGSDGLEHPEFVGPARGDGLLIADVRTGAGTDRTVILLRAANTNRELFDLGERQLAQINVSADLKVAAAFNNKMERGETDLQEIVVVSDGAVRSLSYDRIQFSQPTILN